MAERPTQGRSVSGEHVLHSRGPATVAITSSARPGPAHGPVTTCFCVGARGFSAPTALVLERIHVTWHKVDAVLVGTFVGPLHCHVPRRGHTSTPTISKWEKTMLAVHRDLQQSLRCVEAQAGGGQKPSPASLQLWVGRSRRNSWCARSPCPAGLLCPPPDAQRACQHLPLCTGEKCNICLRAVTET